MATATRFTSTLTLAAAQAAEAGCEAKAKEIGVPMNIAIVDNATHLLSFSRYGPNDQSHTGQLTRPAPRKHHAYYRSPV